MDNYLTPEQGLKLLQQGYDLEYLDEDFWMLLTKDSPIRLLYQYKIRLKREELR